MGKLALRSLFRNRARNVLTIAGVAAAIVAFVLLRTVISAWEGAVEYAAKDRIATRHKTSFVITMPKRYIDIVRQTPGVVAATWFNWFGARDPNHPDEFFANVAVDVTTFLDVMDEFVVPPEQKQKWLETRQGALVGDMLAKKFGWKVGDRITLQGTIFPGDWPFHIVGIYTTSRKSWDRSSLFFHWDYLNDSIPESRRDEIGWITSRVAEPGKGAEISRAIDRIFDEKDVPTLTMSERAMQLSFMGMMSAVLKAIDVVSIVILIIMMLILGNTIAMGVRERTQEYGMLRAIGFRPGHVATFVLGESLIIGGLGGVLGLLFAFPLVEQGIGRWLEENMGSWFPYFRIEPTTIVAALVAALALATLAAILPAWHASRLQVVDALRRIG